MKEKMIFIILLFFFSVTGCSSMDGTGKGAAIGGVSGAGLGGIIGHQSDHGWQGALIGGAAGALAGGLIGNSMDDRQKEINSQHVSITRVAEMAGDGVPSGAIIDEIRNTRSVYKLDSETISYLKGKGVEDEVIDYMMSTSS